MVDFPEGSALLHLMNGGSRLAASGSRSPLESHPGDSQKDGMSPDAGRHAANPAGAANAANAPDPASAANQPPAASRQPPAADRSAPAPTITCGFCGREFVEDPSQATCQACPIKKSCGLMRCPHCGYENAREPGWIAKIKEWIG